MVAAFFLVKITDVSVSGGELYTEKEIEQCAMSDKYAYNSLYFWVMTRVKEVNCLPFTQEIDVKWNGIHSVTLQVYDKVVSGCVKYMNQYIFFDKDGIVLQSLSSPMDGVPIVTGIKFGKFTINEAFDVEDKELFNTIMNLSQLINHYDIQIDQIQFEGKKVTLLAGKIKVYLGKKDFYDDDMAALSSVLETTSKKKLSGSINMDNYQTGDKIILKTETTQKTKKNKKNN